MDGAACESTPSVPNSPLIAAMPALIAPMSGSCWYMIRQITPTANSEIASGMKTAILNATDQTDALGQDGEDQADGRHRRGDDQDPEGVVLERGLEPFLGEDQLVVVEPDELGAAVVEQAPPHRRDHRVDDPDDEQKERGAEEAERQEPLPPGLSRGGAGGASLGEDSALKPATLTSRRFRRPTTLERGLRRRLELRLRSRRTSSGFLRKSCSSVKSESLPKAPGIRSDMSKRKTSAFASSVAVCLVNSSG